MDKNTEQTPFTQLRAGNPGCPSDLALDRLQAGENPGRADGVYGDPRRASAELGQLGVDAIVTASVSAIKRGVARR